MHIHNNKSSGEYKGKKLSNGNGRIRKKESCRYLRLLGLGSSSHASGLHLWPEQAQVPHLETKQVGQRA